MSLDWAFKSLELNSKELKELKVHMKWNFDFGFFPENSLYGL